MKKLLSTQRVALAFAAVMLASTPVLADVAVTVGVPGIAFGYNDGYWDRDHHWHDWRDRDEAARFQAENRDHYYDWKHDRDHDEGWHETDHWWDHH